MLWALGQPVAALGLIAAFVLGATLRALVHRRVAHRYGGNADVAAGSAVGALGAITLVFTGTGWWRPTGARRALAVAAGPVAVLAAGEACLAGFALAFPAQRASLRLNYPSDVLRGVVGVPPAAQVMLSLAVGLLCFGVLALLPVPPLDGFRLGSAALLQPAPAPAGGPPLAASPVLGLVGEWPAVLGALGLLLAAVVPLGDRTPLLAALDLLAAPLVRVWA
ncbi:hypothetical protein [Luedemannella helvata]|uniref:Uncharacterized protein n=1 Tax=Luedemannella helvata TaxID=349315 RepID=A0ABP4XEB2_9ACTN